MFPIIYNFFIIPSIEKKVGKKLGYHPFLSLSPWGKLINRPLEISAYIRNRYKAFKKYNEIGLPAGYNSFSLKQVGYTINMMSKFEIFMSYWVQLNLRVTVIAFIIGVCIAVATNQQA